MPVFTYTALNGVPGQTSGLVYLLTGLLSFFTKRDLLEVRNKACTLGREFDEDPMSIWQQICMLVLGLVISDVNHHFNGKSVVKLSLQIFSMEGKPLCLSIHFRPFNINLNHS